MDAHLYCASGRVIALAALSALVATACARASQEQRFPPNSDEIGIVQTVPAAGTVDVARDVRIDLCWSDFVDPRSVSDLDATISSGNAVVDTDLQVQLVPWRGPGGLEIPSNTESPWCSGSVLSVTPEASLAQGVLHRLRLRPSAVGWEGETIDTEADGWLEEDPSTSFQLEFWVAAADPDDGPPPDDDPPAEEAPTLQSLFEPDAAFDLQRGLCSCHTGTDDDAQALLDLSDPAVAFEGLVSASRIRDTGFPMVTARRPSESFLLHKLLRDSDGTALHGLLGAAMPLDADPIPYADLVAIARWIEAGAEL